jgi:eukaryotic-like serine/threonine-protein kinase
MAVSRHSVPREACVTVPSDGGVAVAPGARRPMSSSSGATTVPACIGRYAIEGVLGAGGMAVVYLARDPVLDREVALKVLHVVDDELGATRLVREGQALARLSHPNVIQVYEVGREADGRIYVAMERVVGETLAAWLEQRTASRSRRSAGWRAQALTR